MISANCGFEPHGNTLSRPVLNLDGGWSKRSALEARRPFISFTTEGTPVLTPPIVWTGPVIAALVLSVLALLVSISSILWQIYSWRRTGPRVTVRAQHAFLAPYAGDLVPMVSITATNKGRSSTQVQGFGFRVKGKSDLVSPASYLAPLDLPADLSVGGEVTYYYYDPAALVRESREKGLGRLRPFVRTGHGRTYGKPLKLT